MIRVEVSVSPGDNTAAELVTDFSPISDLVSVVLAGSISRSGALKKCWCSISRTEYLGRSTVTDRIESHFVILRSTHGLYLKPLLERSANLIKASERNLFPPRGTE